MIMSALEYVSSMIEVEGSSFWLKRVRNIRKKFLCFSYNSYELYCTHVANSKGNIFIDGVKIKWDRFSEYELLNNAVWFNKPSKSIHKGVLIQK